MKKLSNRQVEKILKIYHQRGSIRCAAEAASVSLVAARSYMRVYSQLLKIEGLPSIKERREKTIRCEKTESRSSTAQPPKKKEHARESCRCGQTKQPARDQCAECIRREIVALKTEKARQEGTPRREITTW